MRNFIEMCETDKGPVAEDVDTMINPSRDALLMSWYLSWMAASSSQYLNSLGKAEPHYDIYWLLHFICFKNKSIHR